MKRIGMTESRPEDPEFKTLLANLSKFKTELRGTYNTSRNVTASGEQFHKELERFCGLGLRSEHVFFKEAEFLNCLRERVCSALGKVAEKDINTLNDYVVQYKTAKLEFDATYFQTVKRMRKQGGSAALEDKDSVMQANSDLPALQQAYTTSKEMVRSQRDVIVSNLKNKVGERLLELREVSAAQHHQISCQYFAQRLMQVLEIIADNARNEPSALLDATVAHKGIVPKSDKFTSYTADNNSEASTLTSRSFSQLMDSKSKNNIVFENKENMSPDGNGVRVEEKEEKCESVKSLPNTPETPIESETAVEKVLQDPESNRTTSPYQVIDTQESSREEGLKMGVVG